MCFRSVSLYLRRFRQIARNPLSKSVILHDPLFCFRQKYTNSLKVDKSLENLPNPYYNGAKLNTSLEVG